MSPPHHKEKRNDKLETITEFFSTIKQPDHLKRTEELFDWMRETFPQLELVFKWNQPMFTDHGTYIISYGVSKKHLSVAPETVTINTFEAEIEQAGYQHTPNIITIPWDQEIDYPLLEKIISHNIKDKIHYTKFWRE